MKIHNPLYLPFAIAITIFVALANYNGWSVVDSVSTNTWHRLVPNTQHK